MDPKTYTTKTAAAELGLTTGRIRQLILAGTLRAEKIGRDWIIAKADLDAIRDRKWGRPSN